MVMCAVFCCKNNNNKKLKIKLDKGISFIPFPKDDNLCKIWIAKCGRVNKFNVKNARICSIHFKAEDYARDLKSELLGLTNVRKILKKDAIPSLHLRNSTTDSTETHTSNARSDRLVSRQRKAMVKELLATHNIETATTVSTNVFESCAVSEHLSSSQPPEPATTDDIEYANQDPLENFFGIIRAIGGLHDHPTGLEFKFRLRNYLLGRNETILSNATNVQPDQSQSILKDVNIDLNSTLNSEVTQTITAEMLTSLNVEPQEEFVSNDIENTYSELEHDAVENIAGYIAFKLRLKENLGVPTSQCVNQSYTWTNTLSEGGLYKASNEFLSQIYELEKVFFEINGSTLACGPKYIEKLINNSENIMCSLEAKELYFKCKMFFRMRILNKNLNDSSYTKKRKLDKITK